MGKKARTRRAAGKASGRKTAPDAKPNGNAAGAQVTKRESAAAIDVGDARLTTSRQLRADLRKSSATIDVGDATAVRAVKLMPPSEVPGLFIWVLSIFVAFAAVVSPYGQTSLGYNPDFHVSTYYQVGGALLLLVYFLLQLKRRGDCALLVQRTPLILPVCAFFAWMLVSLLWATSLYEGLVKVLDWGAAVLIFLLLAMTMRDVKSLHVLYLCVFLSGIAISYLGISQYLFGVQWVHQHAAPAATFGNKNMAAQYMVATMPFGLALLLNERTQWKYWLYALGLAVTATFLYYTHARGSWFAFGGQCLVLALSLAFFKFKYAHQFGWNRNKTAAIVAMLLVCAATFNLTPTTFSEGKMGIDKVTNPTAKVVKKESVGESVEYLKEGFGKSMGQRSAMWLNTIPMIKDNLLLGTGIGNWMVHYPKYQAVAHADNMLVTGYFHINTHNDYLEFTSELGLIGVALMLWVAVAFLLSLWRLYLGPHLSDEMRVFMLVAAGSAVGIAASAVVSFSLQQATTLTLIVMCVGCVSAVCWQIEGHPKGPYRFSFPTMPARMTAAVALLSAFLIISSMHYQWFDAEISYRRAVSAMRSGKTYDFGKYAKLAVAQNPLRKYSSYYLGNYYMGRKDYKQAVHHYERVLEDYPWRVELMKGLAIAYLRENQPAKTKEILELWEEIQPHSFDAKATLGTFYYQIGEYERSRDVLEEAHHMATWDEHVKKMLQAANDAVKRRASKDRAAAPKEPGSGGPAAAAK